MNSLSLKSPRREFLIVKFRSINHQTATPCKTLNPSSDSPQLHRRVHVVYRFVLVSSFIYPSMVIILMIHFPLTCPGACCFGWNSEEQIRRYSEFDLLPLPSLNVIIKRKYDMHK